MSTWGTEDEIHFLKDLGTGVYGQLPRIPRLVLLQRYQATMSLRRRWDGIDRRQIEQACRAMIRAASPRVSHAKDQH